MFDIVRFFKLRFTRKRKKTTHSSVSWRFYLQRWMFCCVVSNLTNRCRCTIESGLRWRDIDCASCFFFYVFVWMQWMVSMQLFFYFIIVMIVVVNGVRYIIMTLLLEILLVNRILLTNIIKAKGWVYGWMLF